MSFLKNDFQESIDDANKIREVVNTVIMDGLNTVQDKLESTINKLSSFAKSTFVAQDKVITSLNTGQDVLDAKTNNLILQG